MTTVVLAVVLTTGSARLPAWQTFVCALGAAGGAGRSTWGRLFRKAVRPRLGPPTEFEAPSHHSVGHPRVRLAGYATGPARLGLAATGATLAASFLNAAFGYRLGCEMYLFARRVTVRTQ